MTMQCAIAECIVDRYPVGMKAIRRNLGLAMTRTIDSKAPNRQGNLGGPTAVPLGNK
jgi:hypothetical protein